jgi:hypothetical protein
MQRVKRSTAAGVLPAPPAGGTPGYFTAGDPQTAVPATTPGYEWFNGVQEELAYVIEQAGLTMASADNTQLRQAIQSMLAAANSAVIISGATFAAGVVAGEAVRWDSGAGNFVEAIADGTSNNRAVGFADVTNARVYAYGETPALFAGLTPGSRYYLSGSTAGAITATAPADQVLVGIAKSATTLFVDVDAGAASLLNTRNIWNRAQDVAQVALTDAANIATDASLSNVFLVTLAGNRTLDNPTNLVAGQTIVWNINQDATGGRTLAYGSLFKFPGGLVPVLSTLASAKDTLTGVYDGTILRCSLQKGFA